MGQQVRRRCAAAVAACALMLAGACTARGSEPQAATSEAAPDADGTSGAAPGQSERPRRSVPHVRAVADLPDATADQLAAVDVDVDNIVPRVKVTAMATHPDDTETLYVAQRTGFVRALRDGREEIVLDWREHTRSGGERGLLGLTFSPDGERMYIYYIGLGDEDSHLDEFEFRDGRADASTRREILRVEQPDGSTVHKGGNIGFGRDGMLYVGLGDGGPADEPPDTAQNRGSLLGKLLRIDVRRDGDTPYTVPADNPFADEGDARGEIYAFGLRNPWRWSFDAKTGDMYIADVGRYATEEINFTPPQRLRGANFGWPFMEGSAVLSGAEPEGHVPPWLQYEHTDRCAVIGGFVYRGAAIPDLHGAYVFGDYCDGKIRAVRNVDGQAVGERELGVQLPTLSSFGEGPDGELYAMSLDEGVFKLVPAD